MIQVTKKISALCHGACFDIDGTLATHLLGYPPVGYFEFILAGLLCCRGISPCKALDLVLQKESAMENTDPFLACEALGLDGQAYRSELNSYQQKYLRRHEDALYLLNLLCAQGIRIFITSNNTASRSSSIMHFLGLDNKIQKIYSPQLTGHRKHSPAFWEYVLQDTGISGENMLVIGDEIQSDNTIPASIGIRHTLLLPEWKEREKRPVDWLPAQLLQDLAAK